MIEAKEVLDLLKEKWAIAPMFITSTPYLLNQGFDTGIGDWVTGFYKQVFEVENYGTHQIEDPDLGTTQDPTGLEELEAVVELDTDISSNVLRTSCGTYDWLTFYYATSMYTLPTPIPVSMITSMNFNIKGIGIGIKLYFTDDSTATQYFDGAMGGPCGDTQIYAVRQFDFTGYEGKSIEAIKYWSTYTSVNKMDYINILTTGELYGALDEYVPAHPKYQLVVANKPQRNIFISPNVSKKEQVVTVELHCKLTYQKPEAVDITRTTFLAIKDEVDRIFEEFRFDTIGSVVNMSGWVDAKLPHGFGNQKDPLELVSRFTIEISYYKSLDDTTIGNRVKSVTVLDESLLGLIDAQWTDKDKWVEIIIPKGPILNQQLIGSQYYITIQCHDWGSISTCFYETPIIEGESFYPCNSDGSRTKFSTLGDQFSIVLGDQYGNDQTFEFTDVRVQNIYLEKASVSGLQETVWVIKLKARLCNGT